MEQSKISAFFHEFGFLYEYTKRERVTSVQVARADMDLLDKIPVWEFRDYHMGGIWYRRERIHLVDHSGYQLETVQANTMGYIGWFEDFLKQLLDRWSKRLRAWFFNDYPKRVSGERVKEAVRRVGTPAAIRYILQVTEGSESTEITLFKLPKRFDLSEWIAAEKEREREEVRRQIAAIDGVGK